MRPLPNVGLGADVPLPNLELGARMPRPNLGLGTKKDIAAFWVMIFVR